MPADPRWLVVDVDRVFGASTDPGGSSSGTTFVRPAPEDIRTTVGSAPPWDDGGSVGPRPRSLTESDSPDTTSNQPGRRWAEEYVQKFDAPTLGWGDGG